jgi:hypothetical protein
MFTKLFIKKHKKDSEFSRFIREASSRQKKKVFIDVLNKSTKDQKDVISRYSAKTA